VKLTVVVPLLCVFTLASALWYRQAQADRVPVGTPLCEGHIVRRPADELPPDVKLTGHVPDQTGSRPAVDERPAFEPKLVARLEAPPRGLARAAEGDGGVAWSKPAGADGEPRAAARGLRTPTGKVATRGVGPDGVRLVRLVPADAPLERPAVAK
jgi:hypothetical protein